MSSGDIIAGLHSVRTALHYNATQVQDLWHDPTRHDRKLLELVEQAKKLNVTVHAVNKSVLDQLTNGAKHQGIAAQVARAIGWSETTLPNLLTLESNSLPLLLILDGVQDPHNLGACLRTAEAVGCRAVIAPKDRSVGLTPSVCKVASGAASVVPYIQVTNLARTLRMLKELGIWLVGAVADAPTVFFNSDLHSSLGIIIGGEDKGLRRLTRDHCDIVVKLPMLGVVESLNVSVATGILLYEVLRQRTTTHNL